MGKTQSKPQSKEMTDKLQEETDIRESQGTLEQEVFFGEAGDLHILRRKCLKNPGHKKFIPVNKFNREHLPKGYQDKSLIHMVRAQAGLTVLISVKHVSKERPTHYPNTTNPYPFHSYRGRSDLMRSGSGWVQEARIVQGESFKRRATLCMCQHCRHAAQPKRVWGVIKIITAAHVVYDFGEANHTKCYFFYDDKNLSLKFCPVLCRPAEIDRDPAFDSVQMVFITHDLELLRPLVELCSSYQQLCKMVVERYLSEKEKEKGSDEERRYFDKAHALTVITSHPHGCSKMVSVGETVKRNVTNYRVFSMYSYTTPTCPGSSGAPVFILGRKKLAQHPHRGGKSAKPGHQQINDSGAGLDGW